jgi:predicted transcriptional regulator
MRRASKEPLPTLGELEAAVLEALWVHGELRTPAVHEAVGVPRGLAYTTLLTVLQRLTKKGLVVRRDGGRSHVYTPALTRQQFAARRAELLAGTFVEIGAVGLAAFLTEAERLDPDIVKLLRKRLRTDR